MKQVDAQLIGSRRRLASQDVINPLPVDSPLVLFHESRKNQFSDGESFGPPHERRIQAPNEQLSEEHKDLESSSILDYVEDKRPKIAKQNQMKKVQESDELRQASSDQSYMQQELARVANQPTKKSEVLHGQDGVARDLSDESGPKIALPEQTMQQQAAALDDVDEDCKSPDNSDRPNENQGLLDGGFAIQNIADQVDDKTELVQSENSFDSKDCQEETSPNQAPLSSLSLAIKHSRGQGRNLMKR